MTSAHEGSEYLDHDVAVQDGNDNRKRLIALGAVVGAAAVIGGGAWAVSSFFATGAQPAEALPASTIAYVSLDFDPSGAQKVEAIRMLRKFPAIQEELKLDEDDDPIEKLFDELVKDGECTDLDYADDVKPWLGQRAAMAAVDTGGEAPEPVGVLQTKDADAAIKGIEKISTACGGDPSEAAFVASGEWVVVAETKAIAEDVVAATDKASLAGDDDFTRWTDEAGDDGIVTVFVAKGATKYAEQLFAEGLASGLTPSPLGSDDPFAEEDPFGEDPFGGDEPSEMPEDLQRQLEEFEGMAMKVRFDDASLEIEVAASATDTVQAVAGSDNGGDLVASLPADTVAAFGMGFEDGWVERLVEQVVDASGGETTAEELYADAEDTTGLSLPEDLETLMGEGMAIALGSGIDVDAVTNGGITELPVGVKIDGDPEAIDDVLDKLRSDLGEDTELMELEAGDGVAAVGPNAEYRGILVDDGKLGDDSTYRRVVEAGDDAVGVLYVNFDADDNWLVRLAEDDPDIAENVEQLEAFGISSWLDGDVAHGLVKLTTD
jgi:hypothetical protein